MNKIRSKATKTQKKYYGWQTAKWSLYAGTYLLPLVPSAVLIGINAEEWFAKDGASVGLGFGMLLLTILITILGVAKKDEIMNEAISKLYYFAGVLACWAVSLMFLASVAHEFGTMLLYTSIGLVGGATCDQCKKGASNKVVMYKDILKEVGLDKGENRKSELREKALIEARKEKERQLQGLR